MGDGGSRAYIWLIVFSGLTALSTVVNTWIHWKTLVWRREDAPVRPERLRRGRESRSGWLDTSSE